MAAEPDEASQEAFWKTVANRNEPAVEQLEKLERLQSDITALRNSIKFAGIARASSVTEFLVEAGFPARLSMWISRIGRGNLQKTSGQRIS
jgi:hypothetical protein